MNRRELLIVGLVGTAGVLAPRAGLADRRSTFVYLSEIGEPNRVWGYGLDRTGLLTPLSGNPYSTDNHNATCTGQCETMSFLPGRNLLFASGDQGISVFQVAADGTLALVPGSPFGSRRYVGTVAVTIGARTFVYAADYFGDGIAGFTLGADGTLTPFPTPRVPTGSHSGPTGMTAFGDVLLVALSSSAGVASFKVRSDGRLIPAYGTPVSLPNSSPYNVSVDPSGRYAYVAAYNTASIFGLALDRGTGVLTELRGSPFATNALDTYDAGLCIGKAPVVLAPSSGGNVQAFRRRGNGLLAAVGPEQSTGQPDLMCGGVDPTGAFLVTGSPGAQMIATYHVNPHTGILRQRASRSAAIGPLDGIAFAQL